MKTQTIDKQMQHEKTFAPQGASDPATCLRTLCGSRARVGERTGRLAGSWSAIDRRPKAGSRNRPTEKSAM